eukprot:60891-Rhodomonas_salina.1
MLGCAQCADAERELWCASVCVPWLWVQAILCFLVSPVSCLLSLVMSRLVCGVFHLARCLNCVAFLHVHLRTSRRSHGASAPGDFQDARQHSARRARGKRHS